MATVAHSKGSATFAVVTGLTANQAIYLVVSNKTATNFQVTGYAMTASAKITATVTFDWHLI